VFIWVDNSNYKVYQMAKAKSRFLCQNCGFQSSRYLGRCSDCGAWNTLVEEIIADDEGKKGFAQRLASVNQESLLSAVGSGCAPITEIDTDESERLSTLMTGLDEVLGGGIVPGAVLLLAGDPGIGKSTLLMQVAKNLAVKHKVLYITGEESAAQVQA
jgi:DNA repair protein RadA/Sms